MTLFIAGTDTGVGKTVVTQRILEAFIKKGLSAVSQKWIQTGAPQDNDLETHYKNIGEPPLKKAQCPYAFSFPASPHLAAEMENERINQDRIITHYRALTRQYNHVIVEGSGGILVPFSRTELVIDIVEKLQMPTVLVAENKLGVINQTLLTLEALKARKIPVTDIILNQINPSQDRTICQDNIKTIQKWTGIPVNQWSCLESIGKVK